MRCLAAALVLTLGVPAVAVGDVSRAVVGRPSGDTDAATVVAGPYGLNGHVVSGFDVLQAAASRAVVSQAGGEVYVLTMSFRESGASLTIEGLLWNGGTTPVDDVGVSVAMMGQYDNLLRTHRFDEPPYTGDWVLYPDEVTSFDVTVPLYGDERSFVVSGNGTICSRMPIYLYTEWDMSSPFDQYHVMVYNNTDYSLSNALVNMVEVDAETGMVLSAYQTWIAGMAPWTSEELYIPVGTSEPIRDVHIWGEGTKPPVALAIEQRISGTTRYETAIAASQASFESTTGATAVFVSGRNYPDALSASVLAGVCDGPILLVGGDTVDWGLADEIDRLGVTDAYIVGGTSAVSAEFESALGVYLPEGSTVTRISGSDRYSTCAEVVRVAQDLNGAPFTEAFVARGDSFPDALAASPFSYSQGMPVLLVRPTVAPDVILDVADEVGVTSVYALGGSKALTDACVDQFGVSYDRIAGASRYETAAIIAVYGFDEGWTDFSTLGIATGGNFPDALAGGAAVGNRGGALVLTSRDVLSREAGWAIEVCAQTVDEVWYFGGTAAISEMTADIAHYLCL